MREEHTSKNKTRKKERKKEKKKDQDTLKKKENGTFF